MTRRQFLAASAAAALSQACSTGTRARRSDKSVAIIGAGVAGLHCAYRLRKQGIDAQIFEASNRIGGRMFSARGFFPGGQVAELGGEFIDSNHVTLQALVQELGLELDDVGEEPPGIEPEMFFVRGKRLSEERILTQFRPIAARIQSDLSASESDEAALERLDNTSLSEWFAQLNEKDEDVVELLLEAYRGEYGLEPEEQSVLNLMYLIDSKELGTFRVYGESDERYHVQGGNDLVIDRLGKCVSDQISTGARLVAVQSTAADRFTISIEQGSSVRDYRFDSVVLALPFTLLRRVDFRTPLPPEKQKMIGELGYGTNAKLIGGFRSRPWREKYRSSGSLIATGELQTVWETSRKQDGPSGILTNFLGGDIGLSSSEGTPDARFRKSLTGLDRIFPEAGDSYIPLSALRMHWPSAPFNLGSYACYKPGQWSFSGTEGNRVGNLHFCGEHTSAEFQGFMEGACESGVRVAKEITGDA